MVLRLVLRELPAQVGEDLCVSPIALGLYRRRALGTATTVYQIANGALRKSPAFKRAAFFLSGQEISFNHSTEPRDALPPFETLHKNSRPQRSRRRKIL